MMGLNSLGLKAARVRCGFTQKDLAKTLGMVPGNYSDKENGKTAITLDDANVIAKKLKLSSEEIMDIFFAS